MSDIVWAVGPSTDRTSDLVDRMRQAAFTLLDFEGLRVQFDAPAREVLDSTRLAPDVRRQLLLIFREAVTNVGRHARASELAVTIAVSNRAFAMSIADNGCGFDIRTVQRGQGLDSLSARAAAFGGSLIVESAPGRGTNIRVEVPHQ